MLDTNLEHHHIDDVDPFSVYCKIPQHLVTLDPDGHGANRTWVYPDWQCIAQYYHKYKCGVAYKPEGHIQKVTRTLEDGQTKVEEYEQAYDPARIRLKKVAQLINKQARFMFGVAPDVSLDFDMDLKEKDEVLKHGLDVLGEMLTNILKKNEFDRNLIKAYKDCTIGKRVAAVINFNDADGINVKFLSPFNYCCFKKNGKMLDAVVFEVFGDTEAENLIYLVKYYWLETITEGEEPEERCYIRERIYNHKCEDISDLYEQDVTAPRLFDGLTDFKEIPIVEIINDGLLDENHGVSDVQELEDDEGWLNALLGLDIDALRKNMNAMKYTIDVDPSTTDKVTNRPGGYADLVTDRMDREHTHTQIGILQADLNKYENSLNGIIKNLNENLYNTVDVPDVSIENLSGVITSGKALKAIYWGLTLRCDEKFKTWQPAIEKICQIIIDGCYAYPFIASKYLSGEPLPSDIPYEIIVTRNSPLPEDEIEEKTIDLQEVAMGVMSKQSYLKKWRALTTTQANKEIVQIAFEKSVLEDSAIPLTDLEDNELYKLLVDGGAKIDESVENADAENINETIVEF